MRFEMFLSLKGVDLNRAGHHGLDGVVGQEVEEVLCDGDVGGRAVVADGVFECLD